MEGIVSEDGAEQTKPKKRISKHGTLDFMRNSRAYNLNNHQRTTSHYRHCLTAPWKNKTIWHSHQSRCHWVHRFPLELWGGGGPARFPAASLCPPTRAAPGDDPLISTMRGLGREGFAWVPAIIHSRLGRALKQNLIPQIWNLKRLMEDLIFNLMRDLYLIWRVLLWLYGACPSGLGAGPAPTPALLPPTTMTLAWRGPSLCPHQEDKKH